MIWKSILVGITVVIAQHCGVSGTDGFSHSSVGSSSNLDEPNKSDNDQLNPMVSENDNDESDIENTGDDEKLSSQLPPDSTPRIMYWYGKVNQHVNLETGEWETDPDGVSGADLDPLTYCQKWYPSTIGVEEYQLETIDTWHEQKNKNSYTNTIMSKKCVQPL